MVTDHPLAAAEPVEDPFAPVPLSAQQAASPEPPSHLVLARIPDNILVAKDAELAAKASKIIKLENLLTERENELAQLAQRVEESQSLVQDEKTKLAQMDVELKHRTDDLGQKRVQIQLLEVQLAGKQTLLEKLAFEFNQNSEMLRKKDHQLEDLKAECEILRESLRMVSEELHNLKRSHRVSLSGIPITGGKMVRPARGSLDGDGSSGLESTSPSAPTVFGTTPTGSSSTAASPITGASRSGTVKAMFSPISGSQIAAKVRTALGVDMLTKLSLSGRQSQENSPVPSDISREGYTIESPVGVSRDAGELSSPRVVVENEPSSPTTATTPTAPTATAPTTPYKPREASQSPGVSSALSAAEVVTQVSSDDDGENFNTANARRKREHEESERKHWEVVMDARDITQKTKWDQVLTRRKLNLDNLPDAREDRDLKRLIREGVPREYRLKVWMSTSGASKIKVPGEYQKILQDHSGFTSIFTKQVELDVNRTLPSHPYFADTNGEGIGKLRRVLVAYSWQNPDVGYCQGMNLLVAALLIATDNEEDTFWMLTAIIEIILPQDYYTSQLLTSQADQRVLKELAIERVPRVVTHLDNNGVDLSMITFNWLVTVFVDCVPIQTMFRIWDLFMNEGAKMLFRISLGLLKMHEKPICECKNASAIFNYMKTMTQTAHDIDTLLNASINELPSFPGSRIVEKRERYIAIVKQELAVIDARRKEVQERNRTQSVHNRQGRL